MLRHAITVRTKLFCVFPMVLKSNSANSFYNTYRPAIFKQTLCVLSRMNPIFVDYLKKFEVPDV